jgi:hypothetical protein
LHSIEVLATFEAVSPHGGKKTTQGGGSQILKDIGGQKDLDVTPPSIS